MYTYTTDYAKNYKHRITEILDIIYQFNDFPENIETVVKFYMRNNSRIILCFDNNRIIGAYLYVSGSAFFTQKENIKSMVEVLQNQNIKSNECTVSIFAVVDKNYSVDVYYEMIKLKVQDAIKNGYKYSIININAVPVTTEKDQFCKMSKFSLEEQDFLTQITNTKMQTTSIKNQHDINIVIQQY